MPRRPPVASSLPRKFASTGAGAAEASRRRYADSIRPHHHPSYGFSGAGFLGCYHVGVAACLRRHGCLPHPDEASSRDAAGGGRTTMMPLLTGVSAGSMVAAAILVGVNPDPDGMEVVLEASRRTRDLARRRVTGKGEGGGSSSPDGGGFGMSLDALTPGFSLIDQVEGPFREALARALGGHCHRDEGTPENAATIRDVDPELFRRRVPDGSLRIGLTDRRGLWPTPVLSFRERFLDSYRYVDAYRDVEDIIACSMLSSYIPGLTGPLNNTMDDVPAFLSGLLNKDFAGTRDPSKNATLNDANVRAGLRLNEMTNLGLVKDGKTGLPVVGRDVSRGTGIDDGKLVDYSNGGEEHSTIYWDGGIVDVFPTIDEHTVVVAPLNGIFNPNPSICPQIPEEEYDSENDAAGNGEDSNPRKQQQTASSQLNRNLLLNFLRPYIPTTFRHCRKSQLGLNSANADAALRMMFSSDDDELYSRFRGGYDDARRFLDERGQLSVFTTAC